MKGVLLIALACILLFAAVKVGLTGSCSTSWLGHPYYEWLGCSTMNIATTSGITYWMIVQAPACSPIGVYGSRGGGELWVTGGSMLFSELCPQNLQVECCEKHQWTGTGATVNAHANNYTHGGYEAQACGPTSVTFSTNYYDCNKE